MVNIDRLRQVSLFSNLTDQQLLWLAKRGSEVWLESGEYLKVEGDLPDNFYVLLEGRIQLTKKLGNAERHVMIFEAGTFTGHELILLDSPYLASGRAISRSRVMLWDTDAFWKILETIPSITRELLIITAQRFEILESMSRHHEKLIALGTLAAGLAHELNNPTVAVSRGTRQLHELLQVMPSLDLNLQQQQMSGMQLEFLDTMLRDAFRRAESPPQLDPLMQSDREEETVAWLDKHEVMDGWRLASTLVWAGLGIEWLDAISEKIPAQLLNNVLTWIDAKLTAVGLLEEIKRSSLRVSELVQSVKEYSYLDRAPIQEIDLHQGLESTLTILGHKLKGGITVVREYGCSLPLIHAYGSELNQVWTNLIDNAIDAMNGKGTIQIRTAQENDCVLVEIADNGPGVPSELQERIFEPFFTTKEVGEGTGLGLVICYRIVVERHNGDIRILSGSSGTCFQVRLPIISPKITLNEECICEQPVPISI